MGVEVLKKCASCSSGEMAVLPAGLPDVMVVRKWEAGCGVVRG